MDVFYNDIINSVNDFACFFMSVVDFASIPTLDTPSLNNIRSFVSWLAFFHNPSIFPSVFILGLDAFIVARVTFAFISFVHWVSDLFQNAKVW